MESALCLTRGIQKDVQRRHATFVGSEVQAARTESRIDAPRRRRPRGPTPQPQCTRARLALGSSAACAKLAKQTPLTRTLPHGERKRSRRLVMKGAFSTVDRTRVGWRRVRFTLSSTGRVRSLVGHGGYTPIERFPAKGVLSPIHQVPAWDGRRDG